MTSKRTISASVPPPAPPNLNIPRQEAEKHLNYRIEAGKSLLAVSPRSVEQYEANKHAFVLWNDYNVELLRRMFDSNELANDYASYGNISLYDMDIWEKIKKLAEDIKGHIGRLDSIRERLPLFPEVRPVGVNHELSEQPAPVTNEVFVVHGTDQGGKEAVARYLSKLRLKPIILHEQPSLGDTIIEKLERHASVSCAVVLLTPDDKACNSTSEGPMCLRARQNVILELGYFIGKLGRNRVYALYSKGVELPSDFDGVVYIPFEGAWQLLLAKELKASGLDIDLNDAL